VRQSPHQRVKLVSGSFVEGLCLRSLC